MSSGPGPRGELSDGGLDAASGGVGTLGVIPIRAPAGLAALVEYLGDPYGASDGRLGPMPWGPRDGSRKPGNDQRVDRGVRHQRFELRNTGLKLCDTGDERFELGDADAQRLKLRALPLSVLAGAVRRVALLPGRAGRGGLVLGVEVWRRGHAGIEALGLASNQSPDA